MPELRKRIMRLLGRFPRRASLRLRVEARQEGDGFVRERVTYFVEPGERVAAYLLYPNGLANPAPGIVAAHQHAGQFYLGKSEPAGLTANRMYHYGLDLCRRGYVVVCPDHLAFEERRPAEFERAENGSLEGGNYERFVAMAYILRGSSLQAKYLHDLARAIDVLQSRPEVDKDSIGAIGHSLGGQETLWLAWFDDRVKAAVSSCGFGMISTVLRERINHNMATYVPGLLAVCDMDEIVAGLPSKAFLMTSGEQDHIFPIDGVRQIAERGRAAYLEAGVPDRFRSEIFPAGHSLPDEMKAIAYGWFDRWLKDTA